MIIHKSFGLDLGTTNSTASIFDGGEIKYGLDLVTRSKIVPSIVAVDASGREVVGELARIEFNKGNSNSKKSIKRDMGRDVKFKLGNNNLSPEEISSKIINYCKSNLVKTVGKQNDVVYDKVVITVPAYFSLSQKDATRKAAELCGLEVQMLLEEPSAAAINYALQNNIENGVFFVFDLGGGTFDISILEKTGSIPQVLATAGNNFLGGDNFDFLLARYFLKLMEKDGYDVSDIKIDAANPTSEFKKMISVAENCKRRLSMDNVISIKEGDIFNDGSNRNLTIESFTRREFNNIIKEKVEIDIILECDKALRILEENYGKTIEDITHILLVGGSSKIPYIQETIRKHYCITSALKDVICFEPEFSVSAGAAFVANSFGYVIEDPQNEITINVNAPFVVDGQVYISGFDSSNKLNKIGLKVNGVEQISTINEDSSFMFIVDEKQYSDRLNLNFYINNVVVNNVVSVSSSTVDIIAPTPVQNETIAIEIIDIEEGKTERYPIVESGASLPSETIEYFKINEYSNEQVILPVWEGPRKIFQLIIDLPSTAKIGSRLKVKTCVDIVSNISLAVELDGKSITGRYEYLDVNCNRKEEVEQFDTIFEERINYVTDENERNKLIDKKKNIEREMMEASENNDKTHYESVSQRYEKLITELPKESILTEEDFDKKGDEIIEKINEYSNVSVEDVESVVFYGKRFIQKGNHAEARKCMDELEEMNKSVDLTSSPKKFFEVVKLVTMQIIARAFEYIESYNSNSTISSELQQEIKVNEKEILSLFNKYSDSSIECEEMRDDAIRLIELSKGIYEILQKVAPSSSENSAINAFKGLVSKA